MWSCSCPRARMARYEPSENTSGTGPSRWLRCLYWGQYSSRLTGAIAAPSSGCTECTSGCTVLVLKTLRRLMRHPPQKRRLHLQIQQKHRLPHLLHIAKELTDGDVLPHSG